MKILAFDTTANIESVAILIDGEVVAVRVLLERSAAAEILTSEIATIMAQQNLQPSDFDAIAVTKGPASFTSVRIGLACAKGLALALNKPILTFDSLLTRAFGYGEEGSQILVLLDAKMDEFFAAKITVNNSKTIVETQSRLFTRQELQNYDFGGLDLLLTDFASEALESFSFGAEVVDVSEQCLAQNLALLANDKISENENLENYNPQVIPNYSRQPKIGVRKK